jgi:hypothetical protein
VADLSCLENVLDVIKPYEGLDVLSTVLPAVDFKGSQTHIDRAQAILDCQRKIALTKAMDEAKVNSMKPINSATDNGALIYEIQLSNGAPAVAKLAYDKKPDLTKKYSVSSSKQRHHAILNECAAYYIAALLGDRYANLIPPLVLKKHDDRPCLVIAKVTGKTADRVPGWDKKIPEAQLLDAGFHDKLTAASDRHEGNFMVHHNNTIALIDHECSFEKGGCYTGRFGQSILADMRADYHPGLMAHEVEALQRILAPQSQALVGQLLEPEEAKALIARAQMMLSSGAF